MATWDNVVYTTLGLNLMAKLQTGATLEITRAIGSDGHVSADALPALTEITAKQTLTLSDAIYKGNGQALLPVTLYNRGLTEGYPLRQIGIYATDPDDGEVLMLVAQSETPDTIPTELASPDFVVNFSFHIAIGNAGRINVTYSLTDMATKADYTAFVEQIEGKLGQPSGIATLDSNGKLVQMPTAADVGAVPSIALQMMDPYVSTQLTGSGYVYFACYGLTAGSYLFTACGNFNKSGAELYRATYTAIIHISCDYDSTAKQIIARVRHAPLLISAGFGDNTDSKFDVGFDNMVKTRPWSTWQSGSEPGKIYISATSSTSSSPSDWSCKLLKLI